MEDYYYLCSNDHPVRQPSVASELLRQFVILAVSLGIRGNTLFIPIAKKETQKVAVFDIFLSPTDIVGGLQFLDG